MVIREKYLKKIRPFYHQDIIKVITGLRRSGKSVLLMQIIDEIKQTKVKDNHIIYLNFEIYENSEYTEPQKFNDYIKSLIKDKEKYYLFFDEIQNVKEWERVINSFKTTLNVSIFITGSNAYLLSGELATHIAGRYVSFKLFPFTFNEVCALNKNQTNYDLLFNEYLNWGGMPQIFDFDNDYSKKSYLLDVYNSIIIKDIVERNKIKDVDLLNRILEYLITTPSKIFSISSIIKYFESENRKVSLETIYNYLEYITSSHLINKASRYDIRGKRILTGKYKYYLTDLGFNNILSEGKKEQLGAKLENIVYNELVSRGFTVNYGNIEDLEVDFIATRFEEKIYVQVAYLLVDQNVINREFGVYENITDNYPKYVLSLDKFNMSQNGIIHQNIIDFLLNKEEV